MPSSLGMRHEPPFSQTHHTLVPGPHSPSDILPFSQTSNKQSKSQILWIGPTDQLLFQEIGSEKRAELLTPGTRVPTGQPQVSGPKERFGSGDSNGLCQGTSKTGSILDVQVPAEL